jgi:hypothetical protein
VTLPETFRLLHNGADCNPKDLLSANVYDGLDLGRRVRNDLFHAQHRNGLTRQDFDHQKRRLSSALAKILGISQNEAGRQVGHNYSDVLSCSAWLFMASCESSIAVFRSSFREMKVMLVVQVGESCKQEVSLAALKETFQALQVTWALQVSNRSSTLASFFIFCLLM